MWNNVKYKIRNTIKPNKAINIAVDKKMSIPYSVSNTHKVTHSYALPFSHTHTHSHTHTLSHTHPLSLSLSLSHTLSQTCTLTHTLTRFLSQTLPNSLSLTHTPETFSLGHPALIFISLNPTLFAIALAVRMSVGQEPPSWSTIGSSILKFDSK